MKICEKTFNEDYNFKWNIIKLLNNTIFENSKCQLCIRYREMESNCNASGYYYDNSKKMNDKFEKKYRLDVLNLNDGFNDLKLNEKMNLGHDLPVWINANETNDTTDGASNNNNKVSDNVEEVFNCIAKYINDKEQTSRTVMLIGIDPMRKDQGQNHISLSSPWGIHCMEYRSKGTAKLIWELISSFHTNRWNVYITDRNKLYATEPTNKKGNGKKVDVSKSNNSRKPSKMIECLREEIRLVKPGAIIFIGGGVQDFLLDDLKEVIDAKDKIKFFHIPHPAAHPPHGNWKNIIVSYVSKVSKCNESFSAELKCCEIPQSEQNGIASVRVEK